MFNGATKFSQNLCDWDMSGASDHYKYRFCYGGANCFHSGGCFAMTPSSFPTSAKKYEPFRKYDELHTTVRDYCNDESGWENNSKFNKYG